MRKKLVIAVDIDDVIIATSPLLVQHYNEKYSTKLGLGDMYSNDLQAFDVADIATAFERMEAYLNSKEFQVALPFREAINVLSGLAKQFEIHAVTGRSLVVELATRDMLRRHFPKVFHSFIFTSMRDSRQNKVEACQEISADVLIEDHLGHALPVAEAGIEVLLFGEYPWNQADKLPANVHRVKDWAAVLQYFDEQS